MTTIQDKASRDSLGIDTIARGIAYSAHLLKSVAGTSIEFATNVTLKEGELAGALSIKATIDYNVVEFFASGSDYLEGLQPLTNSNATELFTPLTPATSGIAIPTDDIRVTTLEHYLVWLILLLNEANLQKNPPNVNFLKITQGETPQRFYKSFTFTLSFSPLVYAASGNILEAIDYNGGVVEVLSLGNEAIIDNLFVVGNAG